MKLIAAFAIAFAALAVFPPSTASAAQPCARGWVRSSGGGCLPAGYVDCGSYHCRPGQTCAPGRSCKGSLGKGISCGGGNCPPGEACTPGGLCYNPRISYLCGALVCIKGQRYRPGEPCAACGPRQAAPKYAYECSVCEDGLERNLRAHVGNPRMLATYVDQALAYYDNCKRRARPPCTAGDLFARTVRNGCDFDSLGEAGYHQCIKKAVEQRQQQR